MKTKLQQELATIAPSVSIITIWEHDQDLQDIRATTIDKGEKTPEAELVQILAAQRLEYLRGEIKAERISYGEIAELQDLAPYIAPDDVLLLQWAGVPETI